MQYNILTGALWEVNTTSGIGNKSVDFNKIYTLASFGDTPVITLSGIDKFVVDFDFGHRVHLSSFEYKFTAYNAISSAVASGIKFFSKNESFDTYVSLTTLFHDNIFYTVGSGSLFAPRYIRLSHTLSGTYGVPTASGVVYGFQALNNDTIVDFGSDGNQATESIETARGSAPVIKTIPIYNRGLNIADAFVNLEPKFSPIDEVMYISSSADGPWSKSLDPDELIVDGTNFTHGYGSNINYTNNQLRMAGIDDANNYYSSMYTNGYYLSPIFKRSSTYCKFVFDKVVKGGRMSVDSSDVTETLAIRSSNTCPKPYTVIRTLINSTVNADGKSYLVYKDYWLESRSVKETSSWYFLSYSYYSYWKDYRVVYDQTTERWAGYATHNNNHSYSTAELFIFNNVGTASSVNYRLSYQSIAGTPLNFSWREFKLDATGGMWIYFYCQTYHQGDFVHSSGYYLAYFDVTLTNTFKWYTITEEIGKMDVDYNSKYVWYTRTTTEAIYKVDVVGDIKINFADEDVTYNLGGIAVMPDGNLMFANGKDLHRLKYNGVYLPEYFIEGVAETRIDYIVLDGDGSEAIWTIEGSTIGRLYVSGEKIGTYDFRIVVDFPVRMTPVLGGVWAHCADVNGQGGIVMRFISKENRRIDVEYNPSYNSSPALIYQSYTHPNYTSKMPLNTDTVWSNLTWKKIVLDGFLIPEDQYYQLKVVLRRQEPIERYPTLVTNVSQDFFHDDDFTQSVSTPKQLLWGNWFNYPATDKVYVDTSAQKLVLTTGVAYIQNAFINTSNKMLVGRDINGELDIRIHYTIGAGDGQYSGKVENVYFLIYGAESGYTGKYMGARLYFPISAGGWCQIYSGYNGNWSNSGLISTSFNMIYDGELRLYWNGSTLTAGWGEVRGTYPGSPSSSLSSTTAGDYFYIQIEVDKDGSQLKIDDFVLYRGNAYYYTESPAINSIHKQELVEINNIYPNNYKNIYTKTYIPTDLSIGSNYDMDMKVRWRVPTY